MLGRELAEALNDVEKLPSGARVSAQLEPRYQLLLGRLLAVNGRHEEALKALLAGQEAYKATLGLDYALALGGAYRLAGQMGNAQASYDGALKLSPKSEEAREGLGRLLLMRSREKELLTRLPGDADARKVSMVRGIAYARLNDWKRARQELSRTQINDKFPAEAATWLAVADAAEGDAEKQRAVTALLRDKLLPTAKKNRPTVLVALGRLYMQQNELAKAKEVLEEAAKDPSDYEGNALLGDLLLSSGLPDVALEPLQKAIERNPSHTPSRHLLVHALASGGRMAEAWKLAQAGVADNPASDVAQEDLAFAGLYDGHFKEAEAAIARAVKADATNPERSRLQAQVLFARGQPKEAFSALERANKLNAKDPVTFCEIGNAFVRQGNTDTALRAYEAARREDAKVPCGLIGPFHARPVGGKAAVKELTELAKGSANAWDRALAWASLARLQLAAGQLKDARASAEEGLKESPFSAPALHALAVVALRQKDDAKAVEALNRAVEADGAWGQLHLLLADQLWRSGAQGLPRAIAEYEAFLQMGGSEGEVARVKKALPILKKRLN
jgi:cellulose synthase operon protein C